MSLKDNATIVENTGGQLKYLRNPTVLVDENGINVNFNDTEIFEFEDNRKKCSHIEIFNDGPNECLIGFDTNFESMSFENWKSYALKIYPGKPYNYISLDGEADSISFKTASGEYANIQIIVW